MKRVLLCSAIAVALLSACSKNEKNITDPTPENGFAINSGDANETPYGFRVQWSTEQGGKMLLSNVNIDDPSFSGKITGIQIQIDTLVDGQTYNFMPRDSAAFDKRKNFGIAETGINVDFNGGTIVSGTGTLLTTLRSGSLKIKKESAEVYSLNYVLDYTDAVISGSFTGQMPAVND
jgi:hypothetical protein